MQEETSKNLIEIGLALVGSSFLAVFGFFWKGSHRLSAVEKDIDHLKQRTNMDFKQLRRDVDHILSKIENADNRLHSIVKNLHRNDDI